VPDGGFQKLVFTGMGSSCSAVYPSALRLTEHGFDVRIVEASELIHYQSNLLTPSVLLIAISQSGRSAEILPLLNLAHARQVTVLGITNTPDSLLDHRSNATLLMRAGEEATVSAKTYTCTLALLHLLTSALLHERIDQAVTAIQSVVADISARLDRWHSQMGALAVKWTNTPFIEYLARGQSMASANTAALISKESIKMPTESMNAGQFRHGPLELVDEHFTGMLFMGGSITYDVNLRLAQEIVAHRGQLAIFSHTEVQLAGTEWIELPACPPDLMPLAEIVPIQLFCAEMSVIRGFEAGQFRYISKVTVQE
jgi:glucosamine--fructose-6-phosphate aminotransferase (isomerizing)